MVPPNEVRVYQLCKFFEACQKAPARKKLEHLKLFRETLVDRSSDDVFQIYRLLLPGLDTTRGNYSLKEAKLAAALARACGLDPKVSSDARKAVEWRKGGTKAAGNFAVVMWEYLFKTSCGQLEDTPGARELTVGELNAKLDELATADGEDKVKALAYLVKRTTATCMRWITQIILKDLKIGLSENKIFRDYHEDAEDLYNVTMDLKTVITQLKDPDKRVARKDVEPGKPVRPQLASMATSPEEVFKRMKQKTFVIEDKFDGERMQLHRLGDSVQYFSRKAIEHGERSSYNILDPVVLAQTTKDRLILDGEVVAWNKTTCKFEAFGGLRSTVSAARDGKPGDSVVETQQHNEASHPDYKPPYVRDLELVYIAFDVLYVGDQSVINRPLLERQEMLKEVIKPMPANGIPIGSGNIMGRLVALLPNEPLLCGLPMSRLGNTLDDIRAAFDEAVRMQIEGLVIKAVDSPWTLNDRSSAWLKIKPDYVENLEIDAVIIGGYFGTGRHGGKVAEFLLALAEAPRTSNTPPSTFVSFCRVGTGMSDNERQALRERLAPYLIQSAKAPRCYRVTNSAKERPDLWVKDPTRSVVLQVHADVRFISSNVFATRHSLRFPRVAKIRWDKSALNVDSDEQLNQRVNLGKAAVQGAEGDVDAFDVAPPRGRKQPARKQATQPVRHAVVDHFLPADVSAVAQESDILKGKSVAFCNYGTSSKADLEALVVRLGGEVHQNPSASTTHIIAAEAAGVKYAAQVKAGRDVVCLDWLYECEQQKKALTIHPHHYFSLSRNTLEQHPDVDRYGDLYYESVTAKDVRAILTHHARREDIKLESLPPLTRPDEEPAQPPPVPSKRSSSVIAGVQRTPLDVMMDVEAVLQQHGLRDTRASYFRDCSVCLLSMASTSVTSASLPAAAPGDAGDHVGASPSDQAAEVCLQDPFGSPGVFLEVAAAEQEVAQRAESLARCRMQRLALQVQLHGGRVTPGVQADTTHLLVLSPPQQPLPPATLMTAVADNAGGLNALKFLRQRLRSQALRLVTDSWLEACLAALRDNDAGGARPPELNYPLKVAGMAETAVLPAQAADDAPQATVDYRVDTWPWSEMGVQSSLRSRRTGSASRSRSRSRESGDEAHTQPAARGRQRKGVRAAAPARPRPRPRPRARGKRALAIDAAGTDQATTSSRDEPASHETETETKTKTSDDGSDSQPEQRAAKRTKRQPRGRPPAAAQPERQDDAPAAALQSKRRRRRQQVLEDDEDEAGDNDTAGEANPQVSQPVPAATASVAPTWGDSLLDALVGPSLDLPVASSAAATPAATTTQAREPSVHITVSTAPLGLAADGGRFDVPALPSPQALTSSQAPPVPAGPKLSIRERLRLLKQAK